MKKLSVLSVLILLLAFTSCKNNKETEVENPNLEATESMVSEKENTEKKIVVAMHSSSNSKVQGEVVFTENNGIVKMQGEFSGLNPEGIHAIHLHEKADCSATDGSSAGGHWNPTDEKHGEWDATDGFHLGDIGNLKVDKDHPLLLKQISGVSIVQMIVKTSSAKGLSFIKTKTILPHSQLVMRESV